MIISRNVMMDSRTRILPMPAVHGAEGLIAVMELLTQAEVKLATMETKLTVMDVTPVARTNAETVVLIPEKPVMMDHVTPTPNLLAADSTANCPSVVMVSPMLVRSATMDQMETSQVPTLVDLIAPCPNVVMVSWITCMEKYATKEEETP